MSKAKFLTVINSTEHIEIIKKSKFISVLFPCESEDEFSDKLASIKKEYPGANHYCYAYRLDGHVLNERYNDNGEPSGTAGLPILEVLRGKSLLQCAIVVVRFFGGTKLGTGGLSRAYSDGARDVVQIAQILSKELATIAYMEADYGLSGKIDYFLESEGIAVLNKVYTSQVTYELALRQEFKERQISSMIELSNGLLEINEGDEILGYFNDNKFIEG